MPYTSNGAINLAYDVQGEGSPILLIAGTSADRGIWSQVRPTLAGQFQTIAFDNRDSGQSSLATEPYGVDALVQDALVVLDAASVKQAHVLGHSMGGVVAQELAIGRPERVASLTITNSWARADTYARSVFELARDLTLALDDDLLRLRALYFLGLGSRALTAYPLGDVASQVIASGPLQPREALLRQWALDLELDTLDRLGGVKAATHVLSCGGDRFFPDQHAQQLVLGIAGAIATRMGDDIGHCPMIEAPDDFSASVMAFIRDADRSVAA